jgi:hypothetical protein
MLLSETALLIAKTKGIEDLAFIDLLKSQIVSYDATIRKQQSEKGVNISSLEQTIKCVELVKVNSASCGLGIDNDLVLRTKNQVPKPLLLKSKNPFKSVYNSVISKNRVTIDYLDTEQLEFIDVRRFTSTNVFYAYENDYIYIINALEKGFDLKSISVRSSWDNPLQVRTFAKNESLESNCKCDDCSNEESVCFQDDDYIISNVVEGLLLSYFLGGKNNDNNN